jgi:hypothetical protein
MTGTPTSVGHGAGELDVEAVLRAVAIHRGEQDLPRTQLGDPLAHCEHVDARGRATAVQEHLEPRRRRRAALGIDGTRRTHCAPNSAAISAMSSGRSTAAVLTLTLSAPARSSRAGVGADECRRRR